MGSDDTRSFLLRAAAGGDGARNALLERVRPRIVLWAATRLSPALRAKLEPEDVAQEVLMAAHRALDGFQGTDVRAFWGWIFKIGENRIRDLADHHGAQKRQPVPPTAFTQTSPSTILARGEAVTRVMAAMAMLPEDQRQVILLRRIEEQEVAEVARVMDRTENAVRILYCRALQSLRAALHAAEGSTDSGFRTPETNGP